MDLLAGIGAIVTLSRYQLPTTTPQGVTREWAGIVIFTGYVIKRIQLEV